MIYLLYYERSRRQRYEQGSRSHRYETLILPNFSVGLNFQKGVFLGYINCSESYRFNRDHPKLPLPSSQTTFRARPIYSVSQPKQLN